MDERGGIYVHVPFCRQVCPYCDFAVRTGSAALKARYVTRLLREIELCADAGTVYDTIYFGGGTPSSLAAEDLAVLVAGLAKAFQLAEPWIFLEANPEDVSTSSLRAWRDLGVQTLSLGVQALDDAALRFLGRRHGAAEARHAVEMALDAGFATISVDLMYGLPGQTEAQWRQTLDEAAALAPQHLSCYQLTVHDGTLFGKRLRRGELAPLPEDGQGAFFRLTHERLAELGYAGYEVSNFARGSEHRSRHNLKYWHHAPYLGLGPSAHGFLGQRRWWNEKRLVDYEAAIDAGRLPEAGSEELSRGDLALEALMLGLRTYEGVELARLERCYGVDLMALNSELIARLIEEGLMGCENGVLKPTIAGLAVADGLAARFDLGLD